LALFWWGWSLRDEGVGTPDSVDLTPSDQRTTPQDGDRAPTASQNSTSAVVAAEDSESSVDDPYVAPSRVKKVVDRLFERYERGTPVSFAAGNLDDLRGDLYVGQQVRLPVGDMVLEGQVDSISEEGQFRNVGISLHEELGRAHFAIGDSSSLLGSVFFNGETRALAFGGDTPSDWTVTATSVSGIVCAPSDAIYPFTGNRSGLPVGEGPERESIAAAAGAFTQVSLSSLPGAEYVIYLDFDGETVNSPAWNNGNTINAEPHPQAANDSWVTVVWQRVAEDFIPFEINVTTSRTAYLNADVSKRVKCVITPTDFFYPFVGGVAILNSFGTNTPCWTFNQDEYSCADTISHEVGHTLGLVHDGASDEDDQYFGGHGEGETSWGPIMGATFDGLQPKFATQWSIGEYANAVNYFTNTPEPNTQDDLAVIAANGFGYRTDDQVDSAVIAANSLSTSGEIVDQSGIIETTGDIDFYRFSTFGGEVVIEANGLDVMSQEGEFGSFTHGGNLAIELAIYDDAGVLIDSDNPSTILGASLTVDLDKGDYYLSVQGVGRRDPVTNGFSDYASLGEYFITGLVPTGPLRVLGGDGFAEVVADGDLNPMLDDGTDFGITSINAAADLESVFSFENTGDEDITITEIDFLSGQFSADALTPLFIPAGNSVQVTVTFDPSEIGIVDDTITITYYEDPTPADVFDFSFALEAVATKTADDDNYEENDNYFEAFRIGSESELRNILGPGRQKDNDWYRIDVVPSLNDVTITCEHTEIDGSINLALYDSRGYFLALAETSGDIETLRFTVDDEGGPHYIRVYGANNGNPYNLTWEGTAPLVPLPEPEDSYEPNDDYRKAYNIAAAKDDLLSSIDGPGAQWDRDWYKLVVEPDEPLIMVTLQTIGTADPVGMTLYDSNYRPKAVARNGEPFELISHNGNPGETVYYVSVVGNNTGSPYDLFYSDEAIPDAVNPGAEDPYEDNDNFYNPFDLTGVAGMDLSAINGVGIQKDPDWFEVLSAEGENVIEVSVASVETIQEEAGPLTFTLYESRGYPVLTREGLQAEDVFSFRSGLEIESYYILIDGDDAATRYDFNWVSRFVPEDDDIYEENDVFADAFDLSNREGEPLSKVSELAIQGDEDWYRIEAAQGDAGIRVSAIFEHAEGNISLALYDAGGFLLQEVDSATDNESIAASIPLVGGNPVDYYVLVSGANAGNTYDLTWSSVVDLNDDEYEENNFFNTAFELPSIEEGVLSDVNGPGIQADSDYYRLNVPDNATRLQVILDFTHAEGDIDLAVYNQDFQLLGASISITDDEFVQFALNSEENSFYYLLVYFGNAGNEYDMEWDFTVIGGGDIDADLLGDAWEVDKLGRVLATDGEGNSDGDRFAAWAEYAFDLNPLVADEVELETYVEDGYMHVRFFRLKEAADMGYQYTVVESPGLPFEEQEAVFVEVREVPGNDRIEEVIYRSNIPQNESPSCFFRVKVTKPSLK